MKGIFLFLLLYFLFPFPVSAEPPFQLARNISSKIMNEDDVTVSFEAIYEGISERTVFDRRVGDDGELVTLGMFIFTTMYADGSSVEFQVNPEFGADTAGIEVSFYASVIGQLPSVLRSGIDRVTLHKGQKGWNASCGGIDGTSDINLYTGYTPTYIAADGVLEEALAHEAGHTSLECLYRYTDEWRDAQEADGEFISVYAQNSPDNEDIPESFLAYLAIRARPERISQSTADVIAETIPARIAFFDERLKLEFGFPINAGLSGAWYELATAGQGFFLEVLPETKQIFLGWYTFDTERPPADVTANLGGPGQRWVVALGPYEGGVATLTVYQTRGGVFDAEFPAPVTDMEGDGTITLEFESCTSGIVHYDITSIGRSGSIPIERLAHDNVPLCETLTTVED